MSRSERVGRQERPGGCKFKVSNDCLRPREADAEENFEDADAGSQAGLEVTGDFADTGDAFPVVHGDFEDAEMVLRGLDLHLKVPTVGELRHL